MSRSETIHKLANAIREYRGRTSSPVGAVKTQWVRAPRPQKIARIRELLTELNFHGDDLVAAVNKIDNFKTFDEFNHWLKALNH